MWVFATWSNVSREQIFQEKLLVMGPTTQSTSNGTTDKVISELSTKCTFLVLPGVEENDCETCDHNLLPTENKSVKRWQDGGFTIFKKLF